MDEYIQTFTGLRLKIIIIIIIIGLDIISSGDFSYFKVSYYHIFQFTFFVLCHESIQEENLLFFLKIIIVP